MGRYLDLLRQREIESQTLIRKGRVYINPGEKPPAGKQVKQGTQGGYYYETDGNKVEIYHPVIKRKLTYSDPNDHEEVEKLHTQYHELKGVDTKGLDVQGGIARSLIRMSDEGKAEEAAEKAREKKKTDHQNKFVETGKATGYYEHEKLLPRILQKVRSKDLYLYKWHMREDEKGDQLYNTEEEVKATMKAVVKDIKPHSGNPEEFKSFVDGKIKSPETDPKEKNFYKFIKYFYIEESKIGSDPNWE